MLKFPAIFYKGLKPIWKYREDIVFLISDIMAKKFGNKLYFISIIVNNSRMNHACNKVSRINGRCCIMNFSVLAVLKCKSLHEEYLE